jgi:hypothetical protein
MDMSLENGVRHGWLAIFIRMAQNENQKITTQIGRHALSYIPQFDAVRLRV